MDGGKKRSDTGEAGSSAVFFDYTPPQVNKQK